MIKRTGEHVLTWIGVGLTALAVLMTGLMLPLMHSEDFITGMQEGSTGDITYEEMLQSATVLQGFITFALIINLIALVLAVIGGIFISKKAKTAAILLLIAGIISLLGNWISAILWIIAAIMLFSRKPKNNSLTEDGYYNYDKANAIAQERTSEQTKEEDPYKY